MASDTRAKLFLAGRMFFAAFVLAVLFYYAGSAEVLQLLLSADLLYVTLLMLITVPMIWVSCLKWQLFISACGHRVSIYRLMHLYTMGYFFNVFMPSSVGGDVLRGYHLGKHLGSQEDGMVTTFLERFTGLLAMALLGVVFVSLGSQATAGAEVAILLVGVGAGLLSCFCFSHICRSLMVSVALWFSRLSGSSRLEALILKLLTRVDAAMELTRGKPGLFSKAMILSLAFHMMTIVNTYLACRVIGWNDPDLAGLFVIVPLVLLVSMVPLTPNSLGIQEGAFSFFLQRIGGTASEAFGVGIILRVKVMLIALIGGLVWVLYRRGDKNNEAPIEESA